MASEDGKILSEHSYGEVVTEEVVTNGDSGEVILDEIILDRNETNATEIASNSSGINNPVPDESLSADNAPTEDVAKSTAVVDECSISMPLLEVASSNFTEIRDKDAEADLMDVKVTEAHETTIEKGHEDSVTVNRIINIPEISEISPFACGICSDKFDKIAKFFAHIRSHKEVQSALHCCEIVNEKDTVENISSSELFSCGICNAAFPSMCLLHDHMLKEEMIADYRYQNHVVMPVYGRVVKSKDVAKNALEDGKGTENKTENSVSSRAKIKLVEEGVVPKINHEADGGSESETEEHQSKRQKVDGGIEIEKLNNKAKGSNESKVATVVSASGHSYGTRHQSGLSVGKTYMTEDKVNCKQSKSKVGRPVSKLKGDELKSQSENKSQFKTVYSKSDVASDSKVFERKFEISTRRRTYTTTKIIGGKMANQRRKAETSAADISGEKTASETVISVSDKPQREAEDEVNENNDETVDAQAVKEKEVQVSDIDGSFEVNQEQIQLMEQDSNIDQDKEPNQTVRRKRKKKEYVPCEECGKFLPRKGMARHRVVHRKSRNYPCDLCGKAYKSRSHLTDHKRVVHAARAFKCVVCEKDFKTAKAVEKHTAVHVRMGEIDPLTGTALNNIEDKFIPIKIESGNESQEDKVACTLCDRIVLRSSFKKHLISHSNIRKYKCDLCGAAFKLHSHLKDHNNTVHLKVKKFNCDICQSMFKGMAQLWNHKNQHLNTKDPYYSLEIVEKLRKEQKERSMRKRYALPKTVVCDICGKVVVCTRMNRHKDIHKKSRDFACDICGKKFVSARYVGDHKLKVHTDVRTFCDICGQFFKGKGYLEKHKQIHGPRDKACETCGKTFTTDFYLRMHQECHYEKDAIKCQLCSAAFSRKSKLREHMTDKHNIGEKRPCKYCGITFPSRQKARFHERRVHEGLELKPKSYRKRLRIKEESMTVGEEYHVIVSNNTESGDPQIKILTENFESGEEVTSMELIEAATNSEIQETVTHAQLLDAVIQSGSLEGEVEVQGEVGEEIVQHVLEIPESAEQVCALVLYPDGSYRLVNPNSIGPEVKVVAEVATG